MSEHQTSNECIAIKTSQGWARSSEPCPRCGSGPCHRTSNPVSWVHFAPSEKSKRLMDVMCWFVAPEDSITTVPEECTCPDCNDWLRAPEDNERDAT